MKNVNRRNALKIMGVGAAAAGLAGTVSADDGDNDGGRRFVLIHGAWHGGFAWDGVASKLRKAGHEVEAPTLPGANPNDNRAGIEFGDYVDAVVDVLRGQPRPVILVGHSSAGMLLQAATRARLTPSSCWCSAMHS
jgi:alpha-beta hydrolase superfamily lysophospholipase